MRYRTFNIESEVVPYRSKIASTGFGVAWLRAAALD
jgi:hypothetical protein